MKLLVWIDGGARGNPGPAGYGVVIRDESGNDLLKHWGFLGEATNNVAEYTALIAALDELIALAPTAVEVRTDSELLQRQVTGIYKVREPHLQQLMKQIKSRIAQLTRFTIDHVCREENREADRLANLAMDTRASGREPV